MRRALLALGLLAACHHDAPPAAPSNHTAPAPVSDTTCEHPMMAQQHIADHPCTLRPEQVGCMEPDQACGDAITFAIDPQGQGWWFADTCIPDGWREAAYPQGLGDAPPACDQN